jgi:hypothetical protein
MDKLCLTLLRLQMQGALVTPCARLTCQTSQGAAPGCLLIDRERNACILRAANGKGSPDVTRLRIRVLALLACDYDQQCSGRSWPSDTVNGGGGVQSKPA